MAEVKIKEPKAPVKAQAAKALSQKLINKLSGKRVVVLGDFVADHYIYGMTSRISREAPVLVVRFDSQEYRLGGAANAAHNVQALSGIAIPVGVVGADEAGRGIIEQCRK